MRQLTNEILVNSTMFLITSRSDQSIPFPTRLIMYLNLRSVASVIEHKEIIDLSKASCKFHTPVFTFHMEI